MYGIDTIIHTLFIYLLFILNISLTQIDLRYQIPTSTAAINHAPRPIRLPTESFIPSRTELITHTPRNIWTIPLPTKHTNSDAHIKSADLCEIFIYIKRNIQIQGRDCAIKRYTGDIFSAMRIIITPVTARQTALTAHLYTRY